MNCYDKDESDKSKEELCEVDIANSWAHVSAHGISWDSSDPVTEVKL